MKNKKKFSTVELGVIWSLFYLLAAVAVGAGWVMNIVQIMQNYGDEITVQIILKFVGIFVFPLGAILGWLG